MDSKLKQTAILLSSFLILAVLMIVFIVNKDTTSKKQAVATAASQAAEVPEPIVEVVTTGNLKQVGNDLSAWKSDETFFDKPEDDTLASKLIEMHSSRDEADTTLNRTNPEDDPDNYKVDVSENKKDVSANAVSDNDKPKETKPKKDGSNGYG